jgi:hypothetical protein
MRGREAHVSEHVGLRVVHQYRELRQFAPPELHHFPGHDPKVEVDCQLRRVIIARF